MDLTPDQAEEIKVLLQKKISIRVANRRRVVESGVNINKLFSEKPEFRDQIHQTAEFKEAKAHEEREAGDEAFIRVLHTDQYAKFHALRAQQKGRNEGKSPMEVLDRSNMRQQMQMSGGHGQDFGQMSQMGGGPGQGFGQMNQMSQTSPMGQIPGRGFGQMGQMGPMGGGPGRGFGGHGGRGGRGMMSHLTVEQKQQMRAQMMGGHGQFQSQGFGPGPQQGFW